MSSLFTSPSPTHSSLLTRRQQSAHPVRLCTAFKLSNSLATLSSLPLSLSYLDHYFPPKSTCHVSLHLPYPSLHASSAPIPASCNPFRVHVSYPACYAHSIPRSASLTPLAFLSLFSANGLLLPSKPIPHPQALLDLSLHSCSNNPPRTNLVFLNGMLLPAVGCHVAAASAAGMRLSRGRRCRRGPSQ